MFWFPINGLDVQRIEAFSLDVGTSLFHAAQRLDDIAAAYEEREWLRADAEFRRFEEFNAAFDHWLDVDPKFAIDPPYCACGAHVVSAPCLAGKGVS